jgi:hypothetical protein
MINRFQVLCSDCISAQGWVLCSQCSLVLSLLPPLPLPPRAPWMLVCSVLLSSPLSLGLSKPLSVHIWTLVFPTLMSNYCAAGLFLGGVGREQWCFVFVFLWNKLSLCRLFLNFLSSCLSLPSDGITGVHQLSLVVLILSHGEAGECWMPLIYHLAPSKNWLF